MNQETPDTTSAAASKPWLNAQGSRYFMDWLAEQRVSLAFTTYQTGKLFFIGQKQDNSIAIFERTFGHCMGMWASPDAAAIWLSSRYQIWKFNQAPAQVVPHQPPDPENGDERGTLLPTE